MTPRRHLFLLSLAAFLFTSAQSYAAAFTIFLQTEGPVIQGEATAKGFTDAWQISSFSQGITLPINDVGPSHDPGTPDFSDFAVVKFLDKASALLLLKVADGSPIGKITISFQTQSATPFIAYKVVLENVLVSSISQATSTDTSATNGVTESLKFNFTKITWTYTPQDSKSGGPGTPITTSWDLTGGP